MGLYYKISKTLATFAEQFNKPRLGCLTENFAEFNFKFLIRDVSIKNHNGDKDLEIISDVTFLLTLKFTTICFFY